MSFVCQKLFWISEFNEIINNKTTLTTSIVPTLVTDPYIKQGVIAPGTVGYFEIILNASEVDVDFTYEITSSADEATPLADLRFTKYYIGGVEHSFSNGSTTLTGDLVKNTGNLSILVYFEWFDGTGETMNNAADTSYATNSSYANTKIKVILNFSQKRSA